ncbi:MAG TPA: hypothetical protein VD994_04170 [Prosthecobacter sp.]|nr:hypothetical protein [Prosthecobacter sp.]
MKAPLFALLALVLSLASLSGQTAPAAQKDDNGDELTPDGLWDGRLKGGNYLVRIPAIAALSKHEYIANGAARVVEVNITLDSSTVVRFYFLEPAKIEGGGVVGAGQNALDRARTMAEQAASRVSPTLTEPKVVKDYPNTTHAHTVEFVIKDEERLNSMYTSLNRSLRTGRGRIWRE